MNQHVVVTGASSGIGEATVREWVANGASVTMVARRRALLEGIARSVGGKMHVIEADLSNVQKSAGWLPEAEKVFGPVDVLVNNAGVQIVGPTQSMDLGAC